MTESDEVLHELRHTREAMTNEEGKKEMMDRLEKQGFSTVQVDDGRLILLSRGTIEKLVEGLNNGQQYVTLFIADSPEALKAKIDWSKCARA
jgi:hypothetical protein